MNGHSHSHGGPDQLPDPMLPDVDLGGPLPLDGGLVGPASSQLEAMRCPIDHDLCERCQHPMDPHVVVATGATPMDGGIILCPEAGCTCWCSWCPPGMDCHKIRIPDLTETDELRRDIQS